MLVLGWIRNTNRAFSMVLIPSLWHLQRKVKDPSLIYHNGNITYRCGKSWSSKSLYSPIIHKLKIPQMCRLILSSWPGLLLKYWMWDWAPQRSVIVPLNIKPQYVKLSWFTSVIRVENIPDVLLRAELSLLSTLSPWKLQLRARHELPAGCLQPSGHGGCDRWEASYLQPLPPPTLPHSG